MSQPLRAHTVFLVQFPAPILAASQPPGIPALRSPAPSSDLCCIALRYISPHINIPIYTYEKFFFSKKNTMLTMSSRSCLQCWKHFHGRNAVQSTWLQNIMVQSTQALLISSSVFQLLCTWVLPFQSGADNHINHQVMMRLQIKDSHGPHWNSTFCMAVCKKCESLLSLLFHVPRFPHQNRDNNTSPSPFPLDPDRLKCN